MSQLTINNFTGIKDDGFYWLEGFFPTKIGGKSVLVQGGGVTKLSQKGDTSLANLGLIVGFDSKQISGVNSVYAFDGGYIAKAGNTAFTEWRNLSPTSSTAGDLKLFSLNGIEFVLYTSAQYLCKAYDITSSTTRFDIEDQTGDTWRYTYDGTGTDPNISATNPEVNDIVVIAGDNFTAANNGTFTVTGSGANYFEVTNASGVQDLNKTLGSTGYIRIFNEDFEDLGAEQTAWYRQLIEWEDTMYIGNGNYLASLQDDATAEGSFTASDKQLPNGYEFRCGAANNNYMLVGMNKNDNTGQLGLWDGFSDGWNFLKSVNDIVYSIVPYKTGWIVIIGSSVYFTDGITLQLLSYFPDLDTTLTAMGIVPNGMIIIRDKLIINGGPNRYSRAKKGCWIFDIVTRSWNFNAYQHASTKYSVYSGVAGAVYYMPAFNRIYIGYTVDTTSQANANFIGLVNLSRRNTSSGTDNNVVITPTLDFGEKVILKSCIIEIEPDPQGYSTRVAVPDINITLKVVDSLKNTWHYAQANATASSTTTIKVDGSISTYNLGSIGDEVWVLQGTNGGLRTQIQSITGDGTASEVWTVSPALAGNTEDTTEMNITPFTIMDSTKTLTDYTENRIFFDCGGFEVHGSCMLELIFNQTNYPVVLKKIILNYARQSDPNQ